MSKVTLKKEAWLPLTVAKVRAYVASIGEDDVAKVMESVYQKHRGTKLSEAQEWLHEGRISQAEYEAYCWLWRNLVFHYSDELIEYQIPSNPIR
jgi:hypothetical protein